jgi:hypothetical protein
LGVWGARRSEKAIRAATTKVTVVKKPKTFCTRAMVECIVALSLFSEELVWKEWRK